MPNPSTQHKEVRFPGNSEELKRFLTRKHASLKAIYDATSEKSAKKKVKDYMDKISDVLDLDYFHTGDILSMSELISKIKEDRKDIKVDIDDCQDQLEKTKSAYDDAFKAAGCYMANKFEPEYRTPEQMKLREQHIEYEAATLEYESYEHPWRVRWWLLGMINRPVGFFKNAVN